MGFKRVQCPGCGSNVELDETREFGFCTYCGAKITIDKIIVEHRGQVNISGIADTNSILDRTLMFLEDEMYDEAYHYCEKALDINPRNAEAYVLRLMAETKCNQREDLGKSILPLDTYDSYKKAMRFASPQLQKELSVYNERSKKLYSYEENELQSMRNRLAELEQKANNTYHWTEKHQLYKNITIILNIVLLLVGSFRWPAIIFLGIECAIVLAGLKKADENAQENRSDANYYRNQVKEKEKELHAEESYY